MVARISFKIRRRCDPDYILLAMFLLGNWSYAQEPTKNSSVPAVKSYTKTKLFFGTDACKDCHNLEKPKEDPASPLLCRCTEFGIWDSQDKHRKAYNTLTDPRGTMM